MRDGAGKDTNARDTGQYLLGRASFGRSLNGGRVRRASMRLDLHRSRHPEPATGRKSDTKALSLV